MKADTGSIPGSMPVRASQREATRQRVIAVARELFIAQGYEGTTIRDIARDAGVAVGTVFTTFASKSEILAEVMDTRGESLAREMARVLPHLRGPTIDRLRTMFGAHIQFEMQHAPLYLAHIAAAFDAKATPAARPFGSNPRLRAALFECLAKGVVDGDVAAGVPLDEIADLLLAAEAWTFRLAATEGADVATLIGVMDKQIGLIVDGIRPRA